MSAEWTVRQEFKANKLQWVLMQRGPFDDRFWRDVAVFHNDEDALDVRAILGAWQSVEADLAAAEAGIGVQVHSRHAGTPEQVATDILADLDGGDDE